MEVKKNEEDYSLFNGLDFGTMEMFYVTINKKGNIVTISEIIKQN